MEKRFSLCSNSQFDKFSLACICLASSRCTLLASKCHIRQCILNCKVITVGRMHCLMWHFEARTVGRIKFMSMSSEVQANLLLMQAEAQLKSW